MYYYWTLETHKKYILSVTSDQRPTGTTSKTNSIKPNHEHSFLSSINHPLTQPQTSNITTTKIMRPLFLSIALGAIAPLQSFAFSSVIVRTRPAALAPSSCREACSLFASERRPLLALGLSNYNDLDDLLSDDDESSSSDGAVGDNLKKESLPFQTDGGVIMPEGGANPCVIKVSLISRHVWENIFYIFSQKSRHIINLSCTKNA